MDFIYEPYRIYCEDENGKLLAEITFPSLDSQTANINHTFVDDSLRGQGVAGRLMQAAVDTLRTQGKKVLPTCSYAANWFGKHPEYEDLLNR